MLQAEGRHATDHEAEEILFGEKGRRREHREDVHGRAPVGISHQWQVDNRLD